MLHHVTSYYIILFYLCSKCHKNAATSWGSWQMCALQSSRMIVSTRFATKMQRVHTEPCLPFWQRFEVSQSFRLGLSLQVGPVAASRGSGACRQESRAFVLRFGYLKESWANLLCQARNLNFQGGTLSLTNLHWRARMLLSAKSGLAEQLLGPEARPVLAQNLQKECNEGTMVNSCPQNLFDQCQRKLYRLWRTSLKIREWNA